MKIMNSYQNTKISYSIDKCLESYNSFLRQVTYTIADEQP